MYALYENQGTLDMRSFTIMGMNAKMKSDAIGFFGTGLKNATAVIARIGCQLFVQDGMGNEWKLESYQDSFRDKDFTMLRLRCAVGTGKDIELPYTTELGKNWEPWMAMREFECNCGDENGQFRLASVVDEPQHGTVRIIIKGDEFIAVCRDQRREVFYDVDVGKEAKELIPGVFVAPRATQHYYYRNIMVSSNQRKFSSAYNFTGSMMLTEDRTAKYTFEAGERVKSLFIKQGNIEWRHRLLTMPDAAEWFDFDFPTQPHHYDEAVLEQIEGFWLRGRPLHADMEALVKNYAETKVTETEGELFDTDKEMLDEALLRVRMLGYPADDYAIKVFNSLPKGVLGQADDANRVIKISKLNFEQGLECLMGTLIEEWAHLQHDFRDESRTFQDWLLRQAVVNGQRYYKAIMARKRNEQDT